MEQTKRGSGSCILYRKRQYKLDTKSSNRKKCREKWQAKKGKDKKAVSPTLTFFSDFEENGKREPSPSYFTELPMEGTSSARRNGKGLSGDKEVSLSPVGVKLYFRPGLHTEAVKEGLQQALRHECTVVQIDLGCALQVRDI